MPGRKWYVVAGLIFLIGLGVFGVFLFLRVRGIGEGLQQVVVPGTGEVTLDEPGRYTIYRESGPSVEGVYYGAWDPAGLQVLVTTPSGRSVELLPPGMSESYEFGGRRGEAIFKFEATEPGAYRIDAEYPDGQARMQGVLTVGGGMVTNILVTVFGALAIGGATTVLALAIAIVTFYRRYRARRRIAQPPPGAQPPPPGAQLTPPGAPAAAPPRPPRVG